MSNITTVIPLNDTLYFAPPLINTHPVTASVYIIIDLISLTLGVFGNLFLIATLIRHPKIQKIGREFILNIAVADMCVASIAEPLCLIAVFKSDKYYSKRVVLCEIFAALCLSACFCAFLSLLLLTVSRMVYICYNETYQKLFGTAWKRYGFCLGIWTLAGIFEVGNFLGWGGLHYNEESHMCMWHRTTATAYTYIVSIFLISLPLVLILASNVKIFLTIHGTKEQLAKVSANDKPTSADAKSNSVWTDTIKTCRTLFVVSGAFIVCWTPYAIVNLVDVASHPVHGLVHLFITLLAHAHSAINFTIYVTTNKAFREAFISTIQMASSIVTSSRSTRSTTGATTNQQSYKVSYSSTSGIGKTSVVKAKNHLDVSESQTKDNN